MHPILAIPGPPPTHYLHERDTVQQLVQSSGRNESDDVAAPPVVARVEGGVETVQRCERVHVTNDLVSVAAFRRRADDDGPVQGKVIASNDLSAPELDDFDRIATQRDLHGLKWCWERIVDGGEGGY